MTSARFLSMTLSFATMATLVFVVPAKGEEPEIAVSQSKLINLSARTFVQSGDNVGIAGFIISDNAKRVIVRGLGPSLAIGTTPLANRLANPTLELHNGSGSIITTNDNWRSSQEQAIQDTQLAPSNDLESAIVATLSPANYTAVLRGASNGTGVGLIEIYDLDGANTASELKNLSARGFVGTGDNVLIAGVIISNGFSSPQVLVRALGPELTAANVPSALLNPTLTLHDANGAIIQSNDDWKSASNMSDIQATGLAPTDDREPAILIILSPGNYTAVVRGVNSTTGNALAEVYRLADG